MGESIVHASKASDVRRSDRGEGVLVEDEEDGGAGRAESRRWCLTRSDESGADSSERAGGRV